MTRKLSLAAAALALGSVVLATAPAAAQGYPGGYYGNGGTYGNGGYSEPSRGQPAYQGYDDRGPTYERRYEAPRRTYRGCDNGDGGTVIGAIAGGLAGHELAGRGDRTVGTLLGGVFGALAGRAIDKSNGSGRCR